MDFTTVEFSVILDALNEHINNLRKEIDLSIGQLEKNQGNDELVDLIKKNLIWKQQQLEEAKNTLFKFLELTF